jgi:hypothetical protein
MTRGQRFHKATQNTVTPEGITRLEQRLAGLLKVSEHRLRLAQEDLAVVGVSGQYGGTGRSASGQYGGTGRSASGQYGGTGRSASG